MPTILVDNFGARLTRYPYGDMNSGLAKHSVTANVEVFFSLNNLTWYETPTQIDSAGSVITDLIVCGKERVESGISYIYAVGHLGRVYKIQVNKPSTNDPNFDTPVLLATISSGSPTFTRGGFIDFFGATEKIYIGHDKGLTSLTFDGVTEAAISGTWTQNVPRPLKQFVGKLYAGNGANVAEIDSTGTVTSSTKLSPSWPANTQVRDIDVSEDGNYLHFVVTRISLPDITSTTPDTTIISNGESYIIKWNGTDTGYTASDFFPSFSLNANQIFGNSQYTFGYDVAGSGVFDPLDKILSPIYAQAPLPNAVASSNNLVAWGVPEFYNGFLVATVFLYGQNDKEFPWGWWRQTRMSATGTETDVIRMPFGMLVSNLTFSSSSSGYSATGGIAGFGKVYFSTLETSSGTTKYKLYKFFITNTTVGTAATGIFETQSQLFSKKVAVKEVRIYGVGNNAGGTIGPGWVTNNSFKVDLIGSDLNPITNGTYTFTAGTTLTVGNDYAYYNPAIKPTYALGLRITNIGSANFTITKVEIDYEPAGK